MFATILQQSSGGTGTLVVALLIVGILIAGQWKAFEKAGEPGWAAIVPLYNLWVMVKISNNSGWWFVFFFVPFLNFVALVKVPIDVAKQFGQGLGFGLGLVFLNAIFWAVLGFGDYQYQPSSSPGTRVR